MVANLISDTDWYPMAADLEEVLLYQCSSLGDALRTLVETRAIERNIARGAMISDICQERVYKRHVNDQGGVSETTLRKYEDVLCRTSGERDALRRLWLRTKQHPDNTLFRYNNLSQATLHRCYTDLEKALGAKILREAVKDRETFGVLMRRCSIDPRARGDVGTAVVLTIGLLAHSERSATMLRDADYEHRVLMVLNHIAYMAYIHSRLNLLDACLDYISARHFEHAALYAKILDATFKGRRVQKFSTEHVSVRRLKLAEEAADAAFEFKIDYQEHPYLREITNLRSAAQGDILTLVCGLGMDPNRIRQERRTREVIFDDRDPISVDQDVMFLSHLVRADLSLKALDRAGDRLQAMVGRLDLAPTDAPLGWLTYKLWLGKYFTALVAAGQHGYADRAEGVLNEALRRSRTLNDKLSERIATETKRQLNCLLQS